MFQAEQTCHAWTQSCSASPEQINNMVPSRQSERGDSVSFPEMAVMSQPGFICGAHAMRGLIFSCASHVEVGAYELVKT